MATIPPGPWQHDAAYEILTSPGANVDRVAAIISKHCPFKADRVYQEAAMPSGAPPAEVTVKLKK